jgi:hypothetical protein
MKPGVSKRFLGAAIFLALLTVISSAWWLSRSPGCGFPGDSVAIIDQATVAGRPLWLVHRVSGFQDKVEYVELYAAAPVFDTCSSAAKPAPLSIEAYDPAQGFAQQVLLQGNRLQIAYTQSESEAVALPLLRLPHRH